jgi:Na+/H+-dicarboxylate symporter
MPVQPAAVGAAKPARNWLAILSLIASLVSWLIYPIMIGFIAIILGVFSLYRAKKDQSKIPVTAVLAIIIGLLAIVLNFFWLDIFPPPEVLPPIR